MSSDWLPSGAMEAGDSSRALHVLCQKLRREDYEGLQEVLHEKSRLAKFLLGSYLGETASPQQKKVSEEPDRQEASCVKRQKVESDEDGDSFHSCCEETNEKDIFEELIMNISLQNKLAPIFLQLDGLSESYQRTSHMILDAKKLAYLSTEILSSKSSLTPSLLEILFNSFIAPSLISLPLPVPRTLLNDLHELFVQFPEPFALNVLLPLLMISSPEKEGKYNELVISCLSIGTQNQVCGIKSLLFPIYFSVPRPPTDASLPLMEALAVNKEVLCSIDNQDALLESLLPASESEEFTRSIKFGKLLLGIVKNLPGALRSSFLSQAIELTNRHSSFLKKSILNELSKKTTTSDDRE